MPFKFAKNNLKTKTKYLKNQNPKTNKKIILLLVSEVYYRKTPLHTNKNQSRYNNINNNNNKNKNLSEFHGY